MNVAVSHDYGLYTALLTLVASLATVATTTVTSLLVAALLVSTAGGATVAC